MYARTFSSLGCPDLPLDGVIALARHYGIDRLELRALDGSLELPAYFASHFASPAALVAELAATGMRVIALDTSLKLIGSKAQDRTALLEFLPWAEALGVRWLRVFDGGSQLDAAALAEAADTLRWWTAERTARKARVDFMIETHDVLLTVADITRFQEAMPHPVSLLWDSHHTWRRGGEDPVQTWRAIHPNVVHVHVKDSMAADAGAFTYVLPGQGNFPMSPLRAVLAAEFSGAVSLEWERRWHPQLPPLEEALTAAAAGWW